MSPFPWPPILAPSLGDSVAFFLVAVVLHVTLAAAFGVLAERVAGRRRPALRQVLLRGSTLWVLASPLLAMLWALFPREPVQFPDALQSSVPTRGSTSQAGDSDSRKALLSRDAEDAARAEELQAILDDLLAGVRHELPMEDDLVVPAPRSGVESESSLTLAAPSSIQRPVIGLLAVIWILGAALLAARALLSSLRLSHRLRRLLTSGCMESASIAPSVRNRVCSSLSLPSLPTCQWVSGLHRPLVIGIARPRLLLPVELREASREEDLVCVLLHECAHVIRRDPVWAMLSRCALTAFWFHPLVHVLHACSRRTREELCDAIAVASCDPIQYARTLLAVASQPRCASSLLSLSMATGPRGFERRVRSILDSRRPSMKSRPLLTTSLVLVASLLGGWSVSALSPLPQELAAGVPSTNPVQDAEADDESSPKTEATPLKSARAAPESYRVRPLDRLRVQIAFDLEKPPYLDDELTVQPDGNLPVNPLIGRIRAAGRTFEDIEKRIEERLRDEVRNPGILVSRPDWNTAASAGSKGTARSALDSQRSQQQMPFIGFSERIDVIELIDRYSAAETGVERAEAILANAEQAGANVGMAKIELEAAHRSFKRWRGVLQAYRSLLESRLAWFQELRETAAKEESAERRESAERSLRQAQEEFNFFLQLSR